MDYIILLIVVSNVNSVHVFQLSVFYEMSNLDLIAMGTKLLYALICKISLSELCMTYDFQIIFRLIMLE